MSPDRHVTTDVQYEVMPIYRMAMMFSAIKFFSPIVVFFKYDFSCSCVAADMISADKEHCLRLSL